MTLTVAKLSDTLQTLFTTGAQQASQQAGLILPRRSLSGPAFVQGLVFTWLHDPQATCEELAASVAQAGAPLAVSALHERFIPQAAECPCLVLQQAASQWLPSGPLARWRQQQHS